MCPGLFLEKECKATAFFFLAFEKENVGERMMNVLSKRKENRASGVFWQSKVVDPVFFYLLNAIGLS